MDHQLVLTKDGSHSIYVAEIHEHYHSLHGAIAEAKHVYIDAGLAHINQQEIKLLEIGFGTGLNVLLSYQFAKAQDKKILYHSLEPFPLEAKVYKHLNYGKLLAGEDLFTQLHETDWDLAIALDANFSLKKMASRLEAYQTEEKYDLVSSQKKYASRGF